jgi:hypothetical protein
MIRHCGEEVSAWEKTVLWVVELELGVLKAYY